MGRPKAPVSGMLRRLRTVLEVLVSLLGNELVASYSVDKKANEGQGILGENHGVGPLDAILADVELLVRNVV